jgi:hypothetical protein
MGCESPRWPEDLLG